MPAQTVNMPGPVPAVSDSSERVAFDLAIHIHNQAEKEPGRLDRSGWFKLYIQCLKAVRGQTLESVMIEK